MIFGKVVCGLCLFGHLLSITRVNGFHEVTVGCFGRLLTKVGELGKGGIDDFFYKVNPSLYQNTSEDGWVVIVVVVKFVCFIYSLDLSIFVSHILLILTCIPVPYLGTIIKS